MKYLFLFFILSLVLGCNKRNPEPELSDPIYLDLKNSLASAEKGVEEEKKLQADLRKDYLAAELQTGKAKYYMRKIDSSQSRLEKLNQIVTYWKIRIQTRQRIARVEYSKAFEKGKEWPEKNEFLEYSTKKRLRAAKTEWDLKGRLEELKKNRAPASGSSHGEASPKAQQH